MGQTSDPATTLQAFEQILPELKKISEQELKPDEIRAELEKSSKSELVEHYLNLIIYSKTTLIVTLIATNVTWPQKWYAITLILIHNETRYSNKCRGLLGTVFTFQFKYERGYNAYIIPNLTPAPLPPSMYTALSSHLF